MILETLGGIAGLGGFLGGMGQFVGGVAGLGDGKSELYDGGDHRESIRVEMRNRLKYAQKFGKKYGIHPLVALGISPSTGPSASYGGGYSKESAFRNMGQGLERALAGKSEVEKAQAEYLQSMADLNKLKQKQIIEGQADQTEQIPAIREYDISPQGKSYQNPVRAQSMSQGLEANVGSLFSVKVEPMSKRVYFTLNQDTSEAFESHLTNRLRLFVNEIRDAKDNALDFLFHKTEAGWKFRQKVRTLLDVLEKDMRSNNYLKHGQHLEWDVITQQPIIKENSDGRWLFNASKFMRGLKLDRLKYSRSGND